MNFGFIILIVGVLINFGADKAYKKGTIPDMKSLLKVKMSGVGVSIIGLIITIYMY